MGWVNAVLIVLCLLLFGWLAIKWIIDGYIDSDIYNKGGYH